MRRVFKYILYILLIIAIILVVAWMRARKTAQESGTASPSFRQFLGLGARTPAQPGQEPGTGLTPDFTATDTAGEPLDPSMSIDSSAVAVSQFTSGPQSPTQYSTPLPGPGSSSAAGPLAGGPISVAPLAPGNVIPAPGPGSGPAPEYQCTDADLNIEFTQEEIVRLNALQNRFYAIAGLLHTDADIQTEIINHDQFKSKTDEITELYNYCAAKSPLITEPYFKTRITTPFWRDANRDGHGYVSGTYPVSGGAAFIGLGPWIQLDSRRWDPRNVRTTHAVIEQIFRVNLW